MIADLVDVERALGDQDHVARRRRSRSSTRDPAGVAAHDLDDDHAVVRLGRGVQPVDRVGGDLDRGLEAEREVGRGEVVVDRLRHADDVDAVLVQLARDAERVLAADRDQRVEAAGLHRRLDLAQAVRRPCRRWCGTTRGSSRRGAGSRACSRRSRSMPSFFEHSGPAVAEAEEFMAVGVDALAHDGPDDRIESGAVAAPGEHADSHRRGRLSAARPPVPSRVRTSATSAAARGRYQLRSPSSFMVAGQQDRAHERRVEQDRDGQADAHLLELGHAQRGEDREHGDHHDRRARDDAGRGLDAVRDRRRRSSSRRPPPRGCG